MHYMYSKVRYHTDHPCIALTSLISSLEKQSAKDICNEKIMKVNEVIVI